MEKSLDLQFSNCVAPLPIINDHSLISATCTSKGRREVENKAARGRREKGEGGRPDTFYLYQMLTRAACKMLNKEQITKRNTT